MTLSVVGLPDGKVEFEIGTLPNTDWALTEDVYRSFVSRSAATVDGGRVPLDFDGVEEEKVVPISIRPRTTRQQPVWIPAEPAVGVDALYI